MNSYVFLCMHALGTSHTHTACTTTTERMLCDFSKVTNAIMLFIIILKRLIKEQSRLNIVQALLWWYWCLLPQKVCFWLFTPRLRCKSIAVNSCFFCFVIFCFSIGMDWMSLMQYKMLYCVLMETCT